MVGALRIGAPLVLASLLLGSLPAGAEEWSLAGNTNFRLEWNAGYNSNVIELSERDIDRFREGRLDFTTDLATWDDLAQSVGARFSVNSPEWVGWREGYLSYSVRHLFHARNPVADRTVHYLTARHDLVPRLDVVADYLLVPYRYLRDYYDRDWGTTGAVKFNYQTFQTGLRWSPDALRGLRLEAGWMDFTIYYNPRYTEYDVEGWGIWLSSRYRLNRRWTFRASFQRRWADNVGFEATAGLPPSDLEENAEYGDGSFGEEWYEVGLEYDSPRVLGKRWEVRAELRLRHRFYTSELPVIVDPVHRGRQHDHLRLRTGLETRLVRDLRGGPWLDYEMRSTSSPYEWVEQVKDFRALRAGVELRYSLW